MALGGGHVYLAHEPISPKVQPVPEPRVDTSSPALSLLVLTSTMGEG